MPTHDEKKLADSRLQGLGMQKDTNIKEWIGRPLPPAPLPVEHTTNLHKDQGELAKQQNQDPAT